MRWKENLSSFRYAGAGILPVDGGDTLVKRKWVCLFKLSDLMMFKSFPLFYLKWGFTIRLNLTLANAFMNVAYLATATTPVD